MSFLLIKLGTLTEEHSPEVSIWRLRGGLSTLLW